MIDIRVFKSAQLHPLCEGREMIKKIYTLDGKRSCKAWCHHSHVSDRGSYWRPAPGSHHRGRRTPGSEVSCISLLQSIFFIFFYSLSLFLFPSHFHGFNVYTRLASIYLFLSILCDGEERQGNMVFVLSRRRTAFREGVDVPPRPFPRFEIQLALGPLPQWEAYDHIPFSHSRLSSLPYQVGRPIEGLALKGTVSHSSGLPSSIKLLGTYWQIILERVSL